MATLEFPRSLPAAAAGSTSKAPAGLRLRLRDPSAADGFVDGGWWPRSLDLSVELPPLVAELDRAGHEVTRITYNPAAWNPAPSVLAGPGRPVTLQGSAQQAAVSVSLADTSGAKRTELVVVPAHTDPRVAQRVLALARLGGDLTRIVGIIERANRTPSSAATPVGLPDPLPAAVWESEGGRVLAP
ncbi:MAG TPA: DUF5994 family protein [Actinocrinis sp.]|nr:DUF5994 family protein [Actinocrinis sp.]